MREKLLSFAETPPAGMPVAETGLVKYQHQRFEVGDRVPIRIKRRGGPWVELGQADRLACLYDTVEKVVEKVVEVPVEKIHEVEVEKIVKVPIEKIVTKTVLKEVPIIHEKIVEKKVPVEVIKEVVREVPMTRHVAVQKNVQQLED